MKENVSIPTFILINENIDINNYVLSEFENRKEFDVKLIFTEDDGIYMSLVKCVKVCISENIDFFIFVTNNHKFTEMYSEEYLIKNIRKAFRNHADILLCGIEDFHHTVKISEHLYWVDAFSSSSFIVFFKPIFDKILNNSTGNDIIKFDSFISKLTPNKLTVFPFLSYINKYENINHLNPAHIKFSKYLKVYKKYMVLNSRN